MKDVIWGIDLGKRYIHMVGLPQNEHEPVFFTVKTPEGTRHDELSQLARFFQERVIINDYVFIEEPPFVNNRRTFLALAQTCGALLAVSSAQATVVPVDSWKREVVGKGGVSKQVVADFLAVNHPKLAERANHDQNFMDAACLALYGQQQIAKRAPQ